MRSDLAMHWAGVVGVRRYKNLEEEMKWHLDSATQQQFVRINTIIYLHHTAASNEKVNFHVLDKLVDVERTGTINAQTSLAPSAKKLDPRPRPELPNHDGSAVP